jgi:hypothetical protein
MGRTAFFSAAIERRAEVADFRGKVHFAEDLIEFFVESAGLGAGQVVAVYPKLALLNFSLRADHTSRPFITDALF